MVSRVRPMPKSHQKRSIQFAAGVLGHASRGTTTKRNAIAREMRRTESMESSAYMSKGREVVVIEVVAGAADVAPGDGDEGDGHGARGQLDAAEGQQQEEVLQRQHQHGVAGRAGPEGEHRRGGVEAG